jgi:hypothetical protein
MSFDHDGMQDARVATGGKARRRRKGPPNNLRLGELRRLFLHRARRQGQGMINAQADVLIRKQIPDFESMTADQLGDRIELTFEEKIGLSIRSIRCFDRPKADVQAYYRSQKLIRDQIRAAQKRAEQSKPRKRRSARAQVVFGVIRQRVEMTSPEIGAAIAKRWDFKGRDGQALDGQARRRAVHRALKELRDEGVIEFVAGDHRDAQGRKINRVRLCEATKNCHGTNENTVTPQRRSTQETPQNQGKTP